VAPSISRRTFLLGAAATVGVAACGSNTAKSANGGVITVPPVANAKKQLNLLETTDPSQMVSGVDQRVAFVLRGQQDFVRPDGPVTLSFGPGNAPDHLGPPIQAVIHTDAGPAPDYVTTTYRFPTPGDYYVRATYKGQSADAPLAGIIDPSASQVPIAGARIISTATPTVDNHRGVDPICTRKPACPWHDLSLDTALTQPLPVAVLFATPALCQTATCGPVLEQLLTLKTQFEGKVRFIHSEIYTDGTAKTLAPAVQAYHLQSEPFLFMAGSNGVVRTRIDGLYGHSEVLAALTSLTAG
jgi:hypothetical protein